jgi:SRSO17 transposase
MRLHVFTAVSEAGMNETNLIADHDVDFLEIQIWNQYWAEVERRIEPLFARSEPRTHALAYLAGLLSPVERKNSWQLAEISGAPTPYAFQHMLGRADWDPDALRDLLRTYVTDYLSEPGAVGVLDETGFLKKGTHSAGVGRQYSGTAGRIENCQIGVFLAYATSLGQTLLDRELYLPVDWTSDRARCEAAGIPQARHFATKPALAVQMLERTRDAGIRLAWITGDSVYGDDHSLRGWLEQGHQAYVLAVSGKETVWHNQHQQSVKALLSEVPHEGWDRLSAGMGSKGPRFYDWFRMDLNAPPQEGWSRWLLVRRSCTEPMELTAYVVFGPTQTSLDAQVRVAGMRWTVEESIQTSKGEVGLDHYEVRRWTGWYRHITLAMLAQAFLVVVRAETGARLAPKKGRHPVVGASSLATFKAHRRLQSG